MITKTQNTNLSRKGVFDKIVQFEEVMSNMDNAMFDDVCPLRHIFGDDIYVREITMPAGMVLTSKIHKTNHPFFVIKGDVSVVTEDGVVRIKAPYWGMTKAGTKRVLHIHSETVWITVHATKEKNLDKIENELIAKNYNELPIRVRREIEGDTKWHL